jgi:Holliday junction DNA helicase RuvA
MIASLRGTLTAFTPDTLILDVQGVGFLLCVPRTVFSDQTVQVGQSLQLHTHLVVREDSLTLYGFASLNEKQLFETLLGVSGVGPKLALAIISYVSLPVLAQAVQSQEPGLLGRVPGVGKKTAEKLVFELKDKLHLPDLAGLPSGLSQINEVDTEVIAALTSLGYSLVESQAAIQSIPRETAPDIQVRLRLALNFFS